jgi:8-oxo-dGTP diphosphatase
MKTKNKVFAYIVKDDKLLVFKHTDHPDAGIQVPAGTVEDKESLEEAVLREANEETNLVGFTIKAYLGKTEYHDIEKDEMHNRYFYQLSCNDENINKAKWNHGEKNKKYFTEIDRKYGMIRFDFHWIDLSNANDILDHGHGDLLCKLH